MLINNVWRRRLFFLISLLNSLFLLNAQDTETRINLLLAKMTVEEKIGQLNQLPGDLMTGSDVGKEDLLAQIRAGKVGSVLSHTNFEQKIILQRAAVSESRLGIPLLFGFDVIHGYKTIFPIPLAQAASWDMRAIEEVERIAAREASADGQHWTFSPMVDVSRDPRWGRVMEGSGEDPYLGGKIAEARIKGFQGDDLGQSNTIAACAKHFAGYGFSEAGRDYNTVDMSEQRLREVVLPPFKAAAKVGVATFMNAFNTLNGVPASMNKYLITDILRGEWAWSGLVVSDWNSFGETIVHGAAADDVDAASKCLSAGSDMDMAGGTFQRGLKKALEGKRISMQQLDEAVRRVLRLKYSLGLFDNPFLYLDGERRLKELSQPVYRETARSIAASSMVLLKNQGKILPIRPAAGLKKKIAIVGPMADSKTNKDYMSFWTLGLGMQYYDSTQVVTPAEGLKPVLENMGYEVLVRPVCTAGDCDEKSYAMMIETAREADIIIACVGERGLDCGESKSVASLDLPRNQEGLLRLLGRFGKPVVMVLFNSRPMTFEWASENIPAILVAWQPGFETGNALADVLTGRVNPSGKLPMTFPRKVGQVPIYYNHLRTGRPQASFGMPFTSGYLDVSATPAYPFGHGLSYTEFQYSDITATKPTLEKGESLAASISVTNVGERVGSEVIQCYIQDLTAEVARPVKELKRFLKITLNPGETKKIQLKISQEDLSYWDNELRFRVDPGKFKLFIGGSSEAVKEADFEIKSIKK
ncbi:MAG: beta-glucosidase BglX [Chitinophagales bacterium]